MTPPTGALTLADMLKMSGNSTPSRIRARLWYADSYEDQLKIVHDAVDYCVKDFARTRNHRQKDGEDRLTVEMVGLLKAMGLEASHDTEVAGHCDIVIEGKNDFLWLAEAKIHGSYDWDYKGLQQLSTRYSTGLPGQDCGGLILYCKNKNVANMMEKWTEHCKGLNSDIKIETCSQNPLVRNSVHPHPGSGLPFSVRHTPVALYFNPEDK